MERLKQLAKVYRLRRIIVIVVVSMSAWVSNSFGQQSNIQLKGDPANGAADDIQRYVSEIRQGINHPTSWKGLTLEGDHPAIGLLNNVIDKKGIYSMRVADPIHLLSHTDGTYEVRDIYVKTAETDTLEHQSLALRFDSDAQLIGVSLLPAVYNYQLALDRKIVAQPDEKAAVLKKVQMFQEAIKKRDDKEVSKLLSKDAHVVEGNIARYFYNDQLGPYFQYSVTSPQDFIADSRNEQQENADVRFDDLNIYQMPNLHDVFVVTFHQAWKAGAYADKGYVVMVFDMRKGVQVRLRRWQDDPFTTGSLEMEVSSVTNLNTPMLNGEITTQSPFAFDLQKQQSSDQGSGFFRANKRFILMGVGASAAITVGAILLSGGGDADLPNPPGRPAMR